MNRSGFLTSEFWSTLVSQGLALLALLGVLNAGDAATLSDALSKCVAAAFLFASNALVVIHYVRSRTQLKQSALAGR